ncbi:hypothetical protein TBLA_0C06940 [Henningerozyma blattae CBS 6284]|uniref:Transcription initiation factor TFIID subunit 1 histone acetyltransferase domain-containing protein n=1 Tax=Henningerozyma blattae (strain ATCC 34711 / CBS 6284 / DSM 70876 / NBRC 10599 / NRRL Y-10934 / UCD 77-7) TaxID=1071380 RepID=I2H284_HENB6|nr:hypothetical protein TBLA_0C06940 [Tetrapisispora blattae CBS 6284]CCH60486.1 hypothetical protein TBLA_0C06940 [Tetrapisispora blattae CBS 6284]
MSGNKDLTQEDDAYDAIFNGEFGSLEIGSYLGGNDNTASAATTHLPDAVDFGDEDELADEEDDMVNGEGTASNALFQGPHTTANHFAEHGGTALPGSGLENQLIQPAPKQLTPQQLMQIYFPSVVKGRPVRWGHVLYSKYRNAKRYYSKSLRPLEPLFPWDVRLHVQQDSRRIFKTQNFTAKQSRKPIPGIISVDMRTILIEPPEETSLNQGGNNDKDVANESNELIKKLELQSNVTEALQVATDEWSSERILGDFTEKLDEPSQSQSSTQDIGKYNNANGLIDEAQWNVDNLVNARLHSSEYAVLDRNDEKLLLVNQQPKPVNSLYQQLTKIFSKPWNEKALLQKYNISNDKEYQILKRSHQSKVRSTVSNLNIEHSMPAIKLQSPFYKVNLPRRSLRFFHRPNFGMRMRPGTHIVFSKLKNRKRKRDRGKDVKESFATTQDLTVGDSAPIYLMEYSEQTPISLSKFGMASKLINYYRKLNENDTSRPKLPVGETHVLGVHDKSPFWNFGYVEPGNIVPTLYNNMFRAPIFAHEVSGTDFLLIRSSGNGINNRFYLKSINNLFTVGQTLPIDEIPSPNSRKFTALRSLRLRMIVYRCLNRSPSRSVSIEEITKHFPDQDLTQNRAKVKDFMKFQRDGPEKGLWKLKENEPLLNNANARNLISPEQISEVESMGQGLQFKQDNELFNFDRKLVNLEENLLPWNSTKNFISATQLRAMLQIHGAGDPTGCGEGFSFLKTSMKGGFIKTDNTKSNGSGSNSGHTYNVAQQQSLYNQEIKKTWYVHTKSLSVTNPFEELDNPNEVNKTNKNVKSKREDNKILKITRKLRDSNGVIQRETVMIRDPRIINAYLIIKKIKQKKDLTVEQILTQTNYENDEARELKKAMLQNELDTLEKSQQRRMARKSKKNNKENKDAAIGANNNDNIATSSPSMTNLHGGVSSTTLMESSSNINLNDSINNNNMNSATMENNVSSPTSTIGTTTTANTNNKVRKPKNKNTNRRCATCGQIGHIRTNKSCPMYSSRNSINHNSDIKQEGN